MRRASFELCQKVCGIPTGDEIRKLKENDPVEKALKHLTSRQRRNYKKTIKNQTDS